MSEKLLGYKPMLIDVDNELLLTSAFNVWPAWRIVQAGMCANGHEQPVEGCDCGVHFTTDMTQVVEYIRQPVEHGIHYVPVMGIFQVLGPTVFENHILRSQRAFLWGLVRPEHVGMEVWAGLYRGDFLDKYRPVMYPNPLFAHATVYATWQKYGLVEKE